MDQRDEEFRKKLMATFKIEAREHLDSIASGLIELEKTPVDKRLAVIETVYRESHSLKGAARSVNLPDVVSVCQSMESVFSALKRGALALVPGQFDILHEALDRIGRLVSGGEGTASQKTGTSEIIRRLEEVISGHAPRSPVPERKPEATADLPPEPASTTAEAQVSGGSGEVPPPCSPVPMPPRHPEGPAFSETVRISTAKLDSLFLQAEEMLSLKLATGQRAAELRDAKKLFDQWKKEAAKTRGRDAEARKGREAGEHVKTFPPAPLPPGSSTFIESLDARLAALVKTAEYDHRSFGTKVDNLLDNMKKALMLPFSSLADAFPRLVRDLSRDAGKKADLTTDGGEIEIDRRILEELKDPLMHLVRNCIDHGIETPDERVRKSKPAGGIIRVAAAARDSKIELTVSDDGAGIDLAKIKASAVKQGVLPREEADRLDAAGALPLIFRSGVTSSPLITDLSGRGLGLAIVREKVERLNGSVSVEAMPDEGTVFRMVLPVTLATFRGVLARAGGQVFVLPSVNVERAVRVNREEIKTVENRETLSLDGKALSLVRLGEALGMNGGPGGERRETRDEEQLQAVVLTSAEKRMAFQVDEVLQEQEVLVKTLGRQLSRVRNVAGATVLGSGKVVLIVNVPDLMKSAVKVASPSAIRPVPGAEAKRRAVLIVEDSITSRSLLKNILDSAGYDVQTATDGVDAFTSLRTRPCDLVVSDVQMPRMDGFELTAKIRADKKLSELPVVLVTALETREDRERGIDVGANAYIVKSSFEQSNLLEVVRQLL